MTHRFTPSAERVLNRAKEIAAKFGHTYIGSEHLLLSLAEEEESVAEKFLESHAVNREKIRQAIVDFAGTGSPSTLSPADMTPRTKHIIESSAAKAALAHSSLIGTEHLLAAILEEKNSVAVKLLASLGVNTAEMKSEIDAFAEETGTAVVPAGKKNYVSPLKNMPRTAAYGRDLTEAAHDGKGDPLIGRDAELAHLIRILCRRQKNNPCLIGEPGVGKTALAEGIAAKIASGEVPEDLAEKAVILLDLSSMIAGAKYRGEFEDRLKGVLEEVRKSDRVILFIDEIHVIVGAGAAEGAVDAANILKPALARGEIHLIGATTTREYRLHIEKDPALSRRFEEVLVPEPSFEETVHILEGLKDKYEAHHKLRISADAIRAAVRLSVRYLPDQFLPDKALDLLDEAAAERRVKRDGNDALLHATEEQILVLSEKKLAAIRAQDFESAAKIRDKEVALRQEYAQKQKEKLRQTAETECVIRQEDIAAVLTRRTGIPVTALTESEESKLSRLEEALCQRIKGQSDAITAVCRAVRRSRIGLRDPHRPIGCFLFLGPTGVGKTELSRVLAEVLFGKEDAMIRLDMSEYMERHSVSKLIGSPPGYVGYEEGGQLTERIRRRPYTVLLFDEIEKAHPDVCNLLLQIMEDGTLTDSQGRRTDFSNAVIILTSNVGARESADARPLGFSANPENYAEKATDTALRAAFRPEFLNRLDEIVRFRALTEETLREIAEVLLGDLQKRGSESGMTLSFTKDVASFLVKKGSSAAFGARPLRRAVTAYIEDRITEELLAGTLDRSLPVEIGVEEEKIVLRQLAMSSAQ